MIYLIFLWNLVSGRLSSRKGITRKNEIRESIFQKLFYNNSKYRVKNDNSETSILLSRFIGLALFFSLLYYSQKQIIIRKLIRICDNVIEIQGTHT